jgi:hypothetical protein
MDQVLTFNWIVCVDDGGGPTGTDPKSLHFPTSISFRSNEALCAVTANVMSPNLNKKVQEASRLR